MTWQSIVVGVDGTAESEHAVRWAAREALGRECSLHVARVAEPRVGTAATERAASGPRSPVAALHLEIAAYWSANSELNVRPAALSDGSPAGRLAEYARGVGADVVVVGGPKPGGSAGPAFGAVCVELVGATAAPVVAVRQPAPVPVSRHSPVVAVCDDGATSARVLRSAFDIAGRWGTEVTVVRVERRARAARGVAAQAFRRQLAGCSAMRPDVAARVEAVDAAPAEVALDVARGARLLVVGDRDRRMGLDPAHGSLSHAVLHRAECSVAVV